MRDYQIITDATCDMNQDLLDKNNILVIPMDVKMTDGEEFLHYPDFRNYSSEAFYAKIKSGVMASTTQITPSKYIDFFSPVLDSGKDILYICFSSGMSGTWESSMLAANVLAEKYEGQRVVSIDSLCACGGEGVFALKAAENKQNGMDIDENAKWLTENRLKLAHYFTVDSLDCLKRGGRISKATAIIGTALDIKPILYVNDEGKLVVYKKVRGRKTSLHYMITLTKETIVDPESQTLYITQADCADEAEEFRKEVMREIPCKDVVITKVGPVVGTHTGPDHVCLFSWGTGRIPARQS
ncbi:MAG: DegV family protein [Lachnospiraceae bacterium]|nr:DegV family protein [Lachnospiraceae bacterium]MDD4524797.1 DegV family protein [Lachnospiraceae bacterium]